MSINGNVVEDSDMLIWPVRLESLRLVGCV